LLVRLRNLSEALIARGPDAVKRLLKRASQLTDGLSGLATATVLGVIQDHVPAFRHQLLGISGVSDNTLGATVS